MTSDPEDRDATGEDSTGTQLDILTAATEAAASMVAVYSRTDEGDTKQSIEELLTHTEQALGYEYSDTGRESLVTHPEHTDPEEHAIGINPEAGFDGCAVIYDDGTHPAGVERLIEFVSGEHDVDDVVAGSLAAFGGVDAATRVVERLQSEGVTVHLIEDDLTVAPGDEHARAVLAAARRAARTDVEAPQLVTEATGTSIEWTGGQPPRGFTVGPSGYLQRGEDWETIRAAAAAVEAGELTEYRASKVTGISRHALRTALGEYRDLYRVSESDPLRVDGDADAAEQ